MAKLNGIIQYSGKLGNSVGMRGHNGKNFMRIRKDSIKNPKTKGQTIQRMIMATVAKSISFLAVVLASAVEGKANGTETLSYLRGQWMRMLRTSDMLTAESQYQYLKRNADTFAVNPYLLSKGSIVAPLYNIPTEINGIPVKGIGVQGLHTHPTDQMTASQLLSTVAVGNQITVIVVYDDVAAATANFTPRRVKYCRFAFKDDTTPALIDDGGEFRLNEDAIDLVKADGDWDSLIIQAVATDYGFINVDAFLPQNAEVVAGAIIVSNIANKQRSTSYLAVADGIDKQWSALEAYPTYGNQSVYIDTDSDDYLDNSTRPEQTDVEGVISLQNAPVIINYGTAKGIQLNGVPSQPTEVRLVFHESNGTNIETGNLVGVSVGDTIITQRVRCSTAPTYLSHIWNIGAENYDGQDTISVISGYAICDGVKYIF